MGTGGEERERQGERRRRGKGEKGDKGDYRLIVVEEKTRKSNHE